MFKGDAPDDELWALWCRRGWVKEASHYLKLDRNVQCKNCPNNCLLAPGDRSHCRNKVNRDGTLYTMVYGNPCTFHVDPVEKKPLFHFLPGTPTFSLATSGCVFRCLNCQNWEISQKKPEETKDPRGPELRLRPPLPPTIDTDELARLSMFPDDVVAVAEGAALPVDLLHLFRADRLLRVRLRHLPTRPGARPEKHHRDLRFHRGPPAARPRPYVDAAHVDLKGFSDDTYQRLNSGKLQPILNTLKTYHELGVWFEVINLVVPTYTDDLEMIKRMCGWLVENLGPDRPLHFSRFNPEHKLDHLSPTPVEILVQARAAARAAGLRYVYIGNVREVDDAGTTYCPGCKRAIIERDVFSVTAFDLDGGKCRFCRTPIAGVWPVRAVS